MTLLSWISTGGLRASPDARLRGLSNDLLRPMDGPRMQFLSFVCVIAVLIVGLPSVSGCSPHGAGHEGCPSWRWVSRSCPAACRF
jgi:hypothetical protein